MKKKVAILTRTSTANFGTILQAYALCRCIGELGFEVSVVDDAIPRKTYLGNKKNVVTKKTVKEYLYDVYDKFLLEKKYAKVRAISRKINKFKRRNISFFSPKDVYSLNNCFEIFVSGSDQIWAETAEPYLFPFFMQDFADNEKLKISYAVSVGQKKYSPQSEEIVKRLINDFDYISVREKSSQGAILQYTDKSVKIACDPVFLLSSLHWEKLLNKRTIKEKYIFCYFLSDNEWYYYKIVDLREKLSDKVYIFQSLDNGKKYDGCNVINVCSPTDFLNYICYAEFVLTDSYHATLFSIIFNKLFNVFERFPDSDKNTQNGRIKYILNRLNLEEYYIKRNDKINMKDISYSRVNSDVREFKNESEAFLKSALNYGKDI